MSLDYLLSSKLGSDVSSMCLFDKIQSKAICLINNSNLSKSSQPLCIGALLSISQFSTDFNMGIALRRSYHNLITGTLLVLTLLNSLCQIHKLCPTTHPFTLDLVNIGMFYPLTLFCFPDFYSLSLFKIKINKLGLSFFSSKPLPTFPY